MHLQKSCSEENRLEIRKNFTTHAMVGNFYTLRGKREYLIYPVERGSLPSTSSGRM